MGRCPFQEYQWKVSELYKMTIPEPKNVIFPVTNRAYLAAGAGCWLLCSINISVQDCSY